jgi:hypothetical protein
MVLSLNSVMMGNVETRWLEETQRLHGRVDMIT